MISQSIAITFLCSKYIDYVNDNHGHIETELIFSPCSSSSPPKISIENEHFMLFNIDLGGKGRGAVSLIYVNDCSLDKK